MTSPADDVMSYLQEQGYGSVGGLLQTRARMTMTNSSMYVMAENTSSPVEPFHLDRCDTCRVTITVVYGYGEKAASDGYTLANKIFLELYMLNDVTIGERQYLHIHALGSPTESTYGDDTQSSFTIELIRYNGE